VHDNVLRIVDNKAVLYFSTPSAAEALNWYRGWLGPPKRRVTLANEPCAAINIHIPSSKT
jgi:hypothetical protein